MTLIHGHILLLVIWCSFLNVYLVEFMLHWLLLILVHH